MEETIDLSEMTPSTGFISTGKLKVSVINFKSSYFLKAAVNLLNPCLLQNQSPWQAQAS